MNKRIQMFMAALACMCLLGSCVISVNNSENNMETSSTYPDAERYRIGSGSASAVRELDVEWIAGELWVECDEGRDVRWEEYQEEQLQEDWKMRYYLEDSVLHIRFCQSGRVRMTNVSKRLTLRIPKTFFLDKVRLHASSADVRCSGGLCCRDFFGQTVSGNLQAEGVRCQNARVSSSSGDISLLRVHVHELDVNTVSGDLSVQEGQCGSVSAGSSSGDLSLLSTLAEKYALSSVSGDISLERSGFFEQMTVSNVSGDVRLLLSGRAGFTLRPTTVSGSFRARSPLLYQDGTYRHGDGSATVNVQTVSGDIELQLAD